MHIDKCILSVKEKINNVQKQNLIDFLFIILLIYSLLNKKKALKTFGLKTWCTKKPFGYRVRLVQDFQI